MEDLRKQKQTEQINFDIKKQKLFIFVKKHKIKIVVVTTIFLLLIYPTQIGTYIGQFITDFLGSIIKNISL